MLIRSFYIILLLASLSGSCKKFVDVAPPPTKTEAEKIFNDESSAVSATVGVYSRFMANINMISGSTTIYSALGADELINTAPNTTFDLFRTNSLLATTTTIPIPFWTNPYGFIFHANSVLEALEVSAALPDSVRRQLKGEMLVARSLVFFYLVNVFGDVPLTLTTDYRVNAVMPRTNKMLVYERLIEDMKIAESLLQVNYPSANRFRPNKFTAIALLARLYLYAGQPSLAAESADAVISSGKYSLVSIPNVFAAATSNENIWSLMKDNGNTFDAGQFVPSSPTSRPVLSLTPQLLSSFEANDQRKLTNGSGWLGKNTVAGVEYYYPYKYKLRTLSSGTAPTEFLIVFRLAEQYLIRAEARMQTGDLTGAIEDLNVVRQRASLPALSTSLTAAQLQVAVQKERRIELFCEWGHRWLDLKRTGEANNVLAPIKGVNWQESDQLYPIPLTELQFNPFLSQNPGY